MLIAVYLEGRRIEVRTGAGARVALPDGWLEDMQHGKMVPHFRAGNPGMGGEKERGRVKADLVVHVSARKEVRS